MPYKIHTNTCIRKFEVKDKLFYPINITLIKKYPSFLLGTNSVLDNAVSLNESARDLKLNIRFILRHIVMGFAVIKFRDTVLEQGRV
jgi:hypothetical protein